MRTGREFSFLFYPLTFGYIGDNLFVYEWLFRIRHSASIGVDNFEITSESWCDKLDHNDNRSVGVLFVLLGLQSNIHNFI